MKELEEDSVKTKYVQIGIPQELVDRVEEAIMKSKLGYRNRTEFMIDVIRRHVEKVEKLSGL